MSTPLKDWCTFPYLFNGMIFAPRSVWNSLESVNLGKPCKANGSRAWRDQPVSIEAKKTSDQRVLNRIFKKVEISALKAESNRVTPLAERYDPGCVCGF
ncbi:hypothetical protein [Ruegeria sp. MALMAid1280]|uniref:hypothetical protein n=1 Tax=Ruegeria sp. MALMAid1280 TaxID=3411634 RepID=UPI003BA3B647